MNMRKVANQTAIYEILKQRTVSFIFVSMDGFSGRVPTPQVWVNTPQEMSTPPQKMLTPHKILPKRVKIPKKLACGGLIHNLYNK